MGVKVDKSKVKSMLSYTKCWSEEPQKSTVSIKQFSKESKTSINEKKSNDGII